MRASRLTLYLPDLSAAVRAAPAVRLPLLSKILARAVRRPTTNAAEVLAAQFGLAGDEVPVAALEWLGITRERDTGVWWRAEPVHLLVDRDQMAMWPRAALAVTRDEAQALAATFNASFAAEGLQLQTPQPDSWYLRAPELWHCRTWETARVEGWAITEFMPSGPDQSAVRKLMNEIQMLFHEHPVNQAREQGGKLTINSLWLWGGGALPDRAPKAPARVISSLPLVSGLAALAGCNLQAWSADARLHAGTGDVLVGCGMRDFDGELARLEQQLLRPAWSALRRGHFQILECIPGGRYRYTVGRLQALRFWRRARLLTEFKGESNEPAAN